jgi:2',3'-cyclic-nucleotide 2'-phosphodiesterase (5'-nucleotidase family)
MQFSDLHGKMVPHQEEFEGDRYQNYSGGLTKMATAIKQVRQDDPEALLLMVGDTTHGSAETLFTMGDSVMNGLNTLDIDVFTPGNWDFGHGPRAFRNRFAGGDPMGNLLPLPPNNRTTLSATKPGCPSNPVTCNVTAATFDTVALNLYNFNEATRTMGPLVLPAYKMLEAKGVKVAVLGITTDVVPQQAATFNIGFRFTMGFNELPGIIADARAAGADVIVVQSELGLAKNLQLAKEIKGIDVMFSGHTHERTPEALIVKQQDGGGQAIVTEAGEDTHLGRLELTVKNGEIEGYDWEMIELDDAMPEDPAMKAIVDADRSTFVGAGLTCHTFGPGGFGFGKGHTLCDDLDTVVGTTTVNLHRRDVLEDIANNFMVDAFVEAGRTTDASLNAGNSLSTTNGFRFDNVVLGQGAVIGDGPATASGDITIGDLYAYYPIGAALALASYSGGRIFDHWEGILSHVFDPNPYRQRGGWNLGFTENMHFDIDLVDLPLSISYPGRILDITVDGQPFDRSKVYTLVSCYPHGNPIDEACRTSGAFNFRFMTGTQDPNGVVHAPYSHTTPVNPGLPILDPTRAPVVFQAAPNDFVHPVNILREYLATNVVNGTTVGGLGRVNAVGGAPVSTCDETLVQPIQGAGPKWLARDEDGPCRPQDN